MRKKQVFNDDVQSRQAAVSHLLPPELLMWWYSKRPLLWDVQEHLANPTVNCSGKSEKELAKYIAKNYSGGNER